MAKSDQHETPYYIRIEYDGKGNVTLDLHGSDSQLKTLLTCAAIENLRFRLTFASCVNLYISEGIKAFQRFARKESKKLAPESGIIAKV